MLTAGQQAQAQRRLEELAKDQEIQKNAKNKIKNISKTLNDKLKALADANANNPKKVNETLSKINQEYLAKFLTVLETKNQYIVDEEEKLKNQKESLNREKMNALDAKQSYNRSISQIKETILKIQKAIDQSVKQQAEKRKKIQDDLDKSIAEIKQKIETFKKQSQELQKQNVVLRQKKQSIIKKIGGLQQQFKSKASQKDESVKKDKQDLMSNLKQVQQNVNQATELNKLYATLQKKNFDNKLSIYLRTKKFPQLCNSMQNSAMTIDKCKQQLTKGVHRLQKAIQITKKCEAQSKQINEQCIGKLKIQGQKQQKLKQVKSQKQQVRLRILQLQNQKKLKQQGATAAK